MRVTKRQLRRIIKEEKGHLVEQAGFSAESPGPLEYALASAIADAYEKHVLGQRFEGTGPGWADEVDRAAVELEEGIMDSGVLEQLFRLIDSIDERLHNIEYSHDRRR